MAQSETLLFGECNMLIKDIPGYSALDEDYNQLDNFGKWPC